jgi:hypothetical protein
VRRRGAPTSADVRGVRREELDSGEEAGSLSASYASVMRLKRSSHSRWRSGFLSGCHRTASCLYARRISSSPAPGDTPSSLCDAVSAGMDLSYVRFLYAHSMLVHQAKQLARARRCSAMNVHHICEGSFTELRVQRKGTFLASRPGMSNGIAWLTSR